MKISQLLGREGEYFVYRNDLGKGNITFKKVELIEVTETGPGVEFPDGTRLIVLPEQLSEECGYSSHCFSIKGYQAIEKTVTPGSQTSSRVYVPKGWEGKRVMIVLLDPLEE